MRIAIIGGNNKFIYYLKEELAKINNDGWNIFFFNNSHDFGKIKIKLFNAIIACSETKPIGGIELLKSIREKTNADLYLLCDSIDCLSKTDISYDLINGVLLNDIDRVIDKLKYLETKYRLQKMAAAEDENINRAVISANGYSFEINNDIAFIEIKRILSEESKSGLIKKCEESGINKAIVSYPDRDYIETSHCSQIFEIYKSVSSRGGKMAFYNKSNKHIDMFHECKMNNIIPIFENQEDAVEFLHT